MYNIPLKKDYAVYFQLKVLIQNKPNAQRNRPYYVSNLYTLGKKYIFFSYLNISRNCCDVIKLSKTRNIAAELRYNINNNNNTATVPRILHAETQFIPSNCSQNILSRTTQDKRSKIVQGLVCQFTQGCPTHVSFQGVLYWSRVTCISEVPSLNSCLCINGGLEYVIVLFSRKSKKVK